MSRKSAIRASLKGFGNNAKVAGPMKKQVGAKAKTDYPAAFLGFMPPARSRPKGGLTGPLPNQPGTRGKTPRLVYPEPGAHSASGVEPSGPSVGRAQPTGPTFEYLKTDGGGGPPRPSNPDPPGIHFVPKIITTPSGATGIVHVLVPNKKRGHRHGR